MSDEEDDLSLSDWSDWSNDSLAISSGSSLGSFGSDWSLHLDDDIPDEPAEAKEAIDTKYTGTVFKGYATVRHNNVPDLTFGVGHIPERMGSLGTWPRRVVVEGVQNDDVTLRDLVPVEPSEENLCLFIAAGDEEALSSLLKTRACREMVKRNYVDGWGPVHIAAACGREHIARTVIEVGGADPVKTTDSEMLTPIHIAFKGRSTEIEVMGKLRKLVSSPDVLSKVSLGNEHSAVADYLLTLPQTDVCAEDKEGVMAIKMASENNHSYADRVLTDENAHLITAIINDKADEVREVLQTAATLVNECFCLGWAPMHLAVAFGRNDIVKVLVDEFGADVNVQTKVDRFTGIHLSIMKTCLPTALEKSKTFQRLKNEHSRREIGVFFGFSNLLANRWPEAESEERGFNDIQKYLERRKNAKKPSTFAAYTRHKRMILRYLAVKADHYNKDAHGNMALHLSVKNSDDTAYAIFGGTYTDMIKAVMEDRGYTLRRIRRLNPVYCARTMNECIIDGWALVHVAVALQNQMALRALVQDYGADASILTTDDHRNSLHLAVSKSSVTQAKRKLEKLPVAIDLKNLRATFEDDYLASALGVLDFLLREQRMDVNSEDKKQFTPLHISIYYAEHDIFLKLLKDFSAKTRTSNAYKETPLHTAVELERIEAARELIQKGADLKHKDLKQRSPLELLCLTHGNLDMLKEILSVTKEKEQKKYLEELLLLAVENDNETLLKFILDWLSDINKNRVKKKSDKAGPREGPEVDELERKEEEMRALNEVDGAEIADAENDGNNNDVIVPEVEEELGAELHKPVKPKEAKPHPAGVAFLRAVEKGNIKMADLFVKYDQTVLREKSKKHLDPIFAAAKNGDLPMVKYLWTKTSSASHKLYRKTNSEWRDWETNVRSEPLIDDRDEQWTLLHHAAAIGQVQMVTFLLQSGANINIQTKEYKETALFIACERNQPQMVQLLITSEADICSGSTYHNCLDEAMFQESKETAFAIINSAPYEKLKELIISSNSTIRELVAKMPEVASKLFTQCVEKDDETNCTFNFEILDDTERTEWRDSDNLESLSLFGKAIKFFKHKWVTDVFKKLNQGDEDLQNYENHPLELIAMKPDSQMLLDHPLVLALIRRKWSAAVPMYFATVAINVVWLILLTVYLLVVVPPYNPASANSTLPCMPATTPNTTEHNIKITIIIFTGILMLIEFIQLVFSGIRYLDDIFTNLLDWSVYVITLILVTSTSECGVTEQWHWALASFLLIAAWLDFMLALQRMPWAGLYIVMVGTIWGTLFKLWPIIVIIPLVFAFCFHMLMGNHEEFTYFIPSVVKTFVMMIGEFDYNGVFYNEKFQIFTVVQYIVFILFILFGAIGIVNMFIALAVSDVAALYTQSRRITLGMQIDLGMEVERGLYGYSKSSKEWTLSVNKGEGFKIVWAPIVALFERQFWSDLSRENIMAKYKAVIAKEKEESQTSTIETVERQLDDLDDKVDSQTSIVSNEMDKLDAAICLIQEQMGQLTGLVGSLHTQLARIEHQVHLRTPTLDAATEMTLS